MSWREESLSKWDWLLEQNNTAKPKQILNVIYSYWVRETSVTSDAEYCIEIRIIASLPARAAKR